MVLQRKKVNAEINKDIATYWTPEKKASVIRRIRRGIAFEVRLFEELQDPKVQNWAHKMVPREILHADRFDLKNSIRKYMKKQTIANLGLQKFYPELFIEEKEKKDGKIL